MNTHTTHITEITDADATARGIENWIGTLGRGRRNIHARTVKTRTQAEAWLRRVVPSGYTLHDGAFVWEERDYNSNACGWAAWFN
jgi:hypothetical protein